MFIPDFFCLCLSSNETIHTCCMFKGSASFPTGQEVGLPGDCLVEATKGNLKTFGNNFEFLSEPEFNMTGDIASIF